MQEIMLNPATALLLLAIIGCAVLAVRRLARRGLCNCDDHGDGCRGCSGCAGCAGCPDGAGCPAAKAQVLSAADATAALGGL